MGFNPFKSKIKTTVSTSVVRVLEDKLIGSSAKTGAIKGIFNGGDQLVEYILEELTSSIGVRAERMYKYGKDRYIHGLPNSYYLSTTKGKTIVQGILEQIEGRSVVIDYYNYGSLNNYHYGWLTLVNSYGYDHVSNELAVLSAIKGNTVYLVDMQIVVTEATMEEINSGALDQWGPPATSGYLPGFRGYNRGAKSTFIVDPMAGRDYLRVSYGWSLWIDGGAYETVDIPMSTLDPNLGYFQVKYHYNNGTKDVYKYWTYDDGTGTYPTLDAVFSPEYSALGSYFPFAYFRLQKHSTISDKTTQDYKSSKKLLKYLDMDYDQVAESINSNPNIADVESAVMMMAVPANTTNPVETLYLFDFFSNVFTKTRDVGYAKTPQMARIEYTLHNKVAPEISIVIQDSAYKIAVGFTGIYKRILAGTVCAVGSAVGGHGADTVIREGNRLGLGAADTPQSYVWSVDIPYHYYRKQVTPSVYEEVVVYDLNISYFVEGGFVSTVEGLDKNLLIPLDKAITEHYNVSDRELLYSRSLHYVLTSKIETKVAWYQQGSFKAVMFFVAVAMIAFGDIGNSSFILALAAAETALAVLIILVQYIVIMLLVKLVMKLFIKLVGVEFAMVLAIVLLLVGIYDAYTFGGIQGAPWAADLLSMSNSLMSGVSDSYKDALKLLEDSADSFGIYAKGQTEILENAQKLLEGNNLLSPFTVFGENPDDYYNRTVHSGNVGMLGISAITNYVDIALTLPKLDQTMDGGFTDGSLNVA